MSRTTRPVGCSPSSVVSENSVMRTSPQTLCVTSSGPPLSAAPGALASKTKWRRESKRFRMRSFYFDGKGKSASAEAEPGDERNGEWTRDQLVKMDQRFCAAVQRAIERGLERPQEGERSRAA